MLGGAYFSINYFIGGYSKWKMALSGFLLPFLMYFIRFKIKCVDEAQSL
jgi:hypothetical protein